MAEERKMGDLGTRLLNEGKQSITDLSPVEKEREGTRLMKEAAAKRKVEQAGKEVEAVKANNLTPEHREFRGVVKAVHDRVVGMQMRPSERESFFKLLAQLEEKCGYQEAAPRPENYRPDAPPSFPR